MTGGAAARVISALVLVLVETLRETDPELRIEARNTKGSTENVPLLEKGELDLALVQGEVAHEALTGVGRAPARLPIVAAMYSTPGMFVVRAAARTARSRTCAASRSPSARAALVS